MELAHVTRVTTLGELAASIAHEVNQPLAAIVTNGEVCIRWLDREVPNLGEVRGAVVDVISNGRRASDIIQRLRALSRKTETQKAALDINEAIREVMPLVQQKVLNHRVSLNLDLAPTLPAVLGDRVQLQQVILNLIVNGMEAMATVADRPRKIVVSSQLEDSSQVLVAVENSGVGIDPENTKQLYDAFFTTKSSGMGMGLSICRSIIENHGGKLWASTNAGPGATFQFHLGAVSRCRLLIQPTQVAENCKPASGSWRQLPRSLAASHSRQQCRHWPSSRYPDYSEQDWDDGGRPAGRRHGSTFSQPWR